MAIQLHQHLLFNALNCPKVALYHTTYCSTLNLHHECHENQFITSKLTFTRSTVVISSIKCVLTHPVRSFVSRVAINVKIIIKKSNTVSSFAVMNSVLTYFPEFLCWSNSVIKFYPYLKIKLQHIHKHLGWHAWFLTHRGQRENTKRRPQIREMLHNCTAQDPLYVKSILIIFLNA